MTDLNTTESRGKTRPATVMSDSVDIMFDKPMYLLEHIVMNTFYSGTTSFYHS